MTASPPAPRWLLVFGALCLPGTAALTLRIVWEETFLTASQGVQMVGFSLAHGALGVVAPMLLSTVLLYVWLLITASFILYRMARRRVLPRSLLLMLVAALMAAGPLYVPYGWWRHLVFRAVGPGVHGAIHLSYATASGELYNVRELLRQGVPVDASHDSGGTALSAAAVGGQPTVATFLIEKGADVNSRDGLIGRTPLMDAVEMGHFEMVELLLRAGADASLADNRGTMALAIAREKGEPNSIRLLEQAERN